ncbi:MAG: hypothetical protein GDA51_07885 [Ekhidna sp.]|nr:hypothetical protein [Ekhidna sp.]
MKSYTKNQTVDKLKKELSKIEDLYNSKCVAWTGITSDTGELYSEIIASELLREIKVFDKIQTVTRSKTYYREERGRIKINNKSGRDEENFAKRLAGLTLKNLGLIKDFQIPLKGKRTDKGLGKIDLISFNKENNTLYLIELKYGNKETLLRASLESYTYYKIIDKVKLVNDYFNDHAPNEINVKPAVLVIPDPEYGPYNELKEVASGKRPKLKDLALALDIKYFTVDFLTSEFRL